VDDIELMRKSIRETVALMDRHLLSDRLRRRRVEPSFRATELRAIVDTVLGRFAARAQERGIRLANEVAPGGVHTDPEFVEIALIELLDNAMKYGSEGLVRVSGGRGTDGSWSITVTDAGPGFAPERLEQFMDPIKRMELRDRGLGIGIARHAVKLLGGRLEARTAEGSVSEFTLRVP
jgi:signal transduction histidine kinase